MRWSRRGAPIPRRALWLLLCATLPGPVRAQATAPDTAAVDPPLTISLVTIGPGGEPWERFGHNMLRVRGGASALDMVWDWGRFSFDTERFFIRFAQGDLRYWMQGAQAGGVIDYYARSGRSVQEQVLELSQGQADKLLKFLRWNDTEEHRFYQYHYYNDNCSTRVRDALDTVLGGVIRARTAEVVTPWSYRDQTKRLNQHNPFLYFGLTTLLAGATDHKITAWEEMFLPGSLERWVREIRVVGEDGVTRPLVASEVEIAPVGAYPVPDAPAQWWPGFLACGILAGLILALAGRSRGGGHRAFVPVAVGYCLGAGLLGLTMALLWAVSGHQVAWRNENLWQFNLAALALLPLLPAAGRGRGPRADAALTLAKVILACSALGVVLKALPWFAQANWDVIALALPINLGLFLGVLGSRETAVGGER